MLQITEAGRARVQDGGFKMAVVKIAQDSFYRGLTPEQTNEGLEIFTIMALCADASNLLTVQNPEHIEFNEFMAQESNRVAVAEALTVIAQEILVAMGEMPCH